MAITLTKNQQKAVDIAFDHFKKRQETIIAGYAGTGKSTSVRFLLEKLENELGVFEDDVMFSAFTGKACQVLTNKGCRAMTLHKLLYKVKVDKYGDISFELKDHLPYKLVVIDECSMAPLSMIEELRTFNIPIVFLGDPGQLPTINKEDDNHLLEHPDIFLTEVLRQALDSPIILLSMKIRKGESIDDFNYDEAKVIHRNQLTEEDLKNANMILVGTNKMRQKINKAMRAFYGKKGIIDEGEKLICTQNYWEDLIEVSLTNGTVGNFSHWRESSKSYFKGSLKVPTIVGEFTSEFGLKKTIHLDKKFITEEVSCLTQRQKAHIKPRLLCPREFTYAYAITGHKAQGSEWDNVIVFEEDFPYGADHVKWLYTCVTRAKKKVILVRG